MLQLFSPLLIKYGKAIMTSKEQTDAYHAQGTACDLATAVSGIMSHDEFQMNGRKKAHKGKGKI